MRQGSTAYVSYRLLTADGADLGLIAHPAPNVERGDVVADGRLGLWLVAFRIEIGEGEPPVLVVEDDGA